MAPSIKFSVKGVERGQVSVPIKPGIYPAKVQKMEYREAKNDLQTIIEITAGKYKGQTIWTWINLGESSAWKLAEFIDAIPAAPETGTVDALIKKVTGKALAVQTDRRPYDGEDRNSIKNFLPISSLDEDPDEEEDEDDDDIEEDEDEDEDDDAAEDDEDEDEEDDEEDDDDDEEDEPDYASMSIKDLRAAAKAKDIDTAGLKKADLIEALTSEDDEEDEEDDEEPEDYTEWDEDELKEELESRGLKTNGSKKLLIKRLEKDDASGKPF